MQLPAKKKNYGNKRPRIFALCFVKNEDDIIADSLLHAAHFCDRIYVVDNKSSDRTWEIVKNIDCDVIVPVGTVDFEHRDYLRTWFMGSRKNELGINNWWYILDADEFLIGDPFRAIARAESENADIVAVDMINFHISRDEALEATATGKKETWRDRKYYELYESGKVEFFKNTRYLNYDICDFLPLGLTGEGPERLPVKHYPYRSMEQLKKRIRTRQRNREFASE